MYRIYTKLDDKNLRISQIHHKRKENSIEKKNSMMNIFGKMSNIFGKIPNIFGKIPNIVLAIFIIASGMATVSSGMYENVINDTYQEGTKYIEEKSFADNNGYKLVWNDEFDGTVLDSKFWSPRYPSGTYAYTSANVKVSDGNLVLTATNDGGKVKYGAAITLNKYNFKYGYIEIRTKVARGKGLSSGLWLTGRDHYPPEIDIMEHIGRDTNALYLSRHCNTNNDATCDGWNQFPNRPWWLYWTKRYVASDWTLNYHLYGIEWTPYYIRWIVDGVERYRVNTGVSQEYMWITLSLCGNKCLGTFDGPTDSTTPFPSKMYVDYVRVYQKGQSSTGVAVISPNGGETLERGVAKKISWSSKGNTGSHVKVELLKNEKVNKIIDSNTLNDGSYDWVVPPTQTPGTDYKIRIKSTSGSEDTSNSNFAISPITVTSPNGGDNWIRGKTKTIKWSYTGNPGAYVKIELLKGDVLSRVITNSAPIGSSGTGYYNWLVPLSQILGNNYKIRVTSKSNSAYKDISNNYFKIGTNTPSVTIYSPNGGESLIRGNTKTIKWSSIGNIGTYVKIELIKGGIFNRRINPSTENDGSYSWTIPWNQAKGSDYKIRITSTSNPIYTDMSNSYFKIN